MNKKITSHLTFQQIKVLKLCFKGLSNKEISDTLFISVLTVKRHKQDIAKALNLKGKQAFRMFVNELTADDFPENA